MGAVCSKLKLIFSCILIYNIYNKIISYSSQIIKFSFLLEKKNTYKIGLSMRFYGWVWVMGGSNEGRRHQISMHMNKVNEGLWLLWLSFNWFDRFWSSLRISIHTLIYIYICCHGHDMDHVIAHRLTITTKQRSYHDHLPCQRTFVFSLRHLSLPFTKTPVLSLPSNCNFQAWQPGPPYPGPFPPWVSLR